VNHLALDILIAVLTNNDEVGVRADLFLRDTVPCSSPAGDAAGLEPQNEFIGKGYRVFIEDVLGRNLLIQARGLLE
jgi:hypothetical protein